MKIGLLGGSFDPIHNGHLALAEAAKSAANLDQVIFLPVGNPAHRAPLRAPPEQRAAWLRMACVNRLDFQVDCREFTQSDSRTIWTARAYREAHPNAELYWILGADSFASLTTWHDWQELTQLIRFIIAPREGQAVVLPEGTAQMLATRVVILQSALPNISATAIRAALRGKRTILQALAEPVLTQLPRQVLENSVESGLYF